MKRMLVFFFLLALSIGIDYRALDLDDARKDTITITVSGEAEEAGPLAIPDRSTVRDVLDELSLTDEADISTLNPELVLHDHDVLFIPTKPKEDSARRVSINTAGQAELTSLPGIGPSMAERIIAYRNENGLFQSTEELMNVRGIGQSKYEALLEFITL